MSENLDDALNNEAYLCGRLLAFYDSLQWAAHEGEVGVTVADRYFSLASTYPAVAFPKIVDLVRIPEDGDRHSELMSITIPKSCR